MKLIVLSKSTKLSFQLSMLDAKLVCLCHILNFYLLSSIASGYSPVRIEMHVVSGKECGSAGYPR